MVNKLKAYLIPFAVLFIGVSYSGAYFSDSISVTNNNFSVGEWDAGPRVVINEVMYDSAETGVDTRYEWVELYNAGESAVDMINFRLSDGETDFDLPSLILNSGSYAVFARNAETFLLQHEFSPDFSGSSIALSNSGDDLTLYDSDLSVVDTIVWEEGSFPGIIPHLGVSAGHSIARLPDGVDTDDCSIDFIELEIPTPGDSNI